MAAAWPSIKMIQITLFLLYLYIQILLKLRGSLTNTVFGGVEKLYSIYVTFLEFSASDDGEHSIYNKSPGNFLA